MKKAAALEGKDGGRCGRREREKTGRVDDERRNTRRFLVPGLQSSPPAGRSYPVFDYRVECLCRCPLSEMLRRTRRPP